MTGDNGLHGTDEEWESRFNQQVDAGDLSSYPRLFAGFERQGSPLSPETLTSGYVRAALANLDRGEAAVAGVYAQLAMVSALDYHTACMSRAADQAADKLFMGMPPS